MYFQHTGNSLGHSYKVVNSVNAINMMGNIFSFDVIKLYNDYTRTDCKHTFNIKVLLQLQNSVPTCTY